MNIKLSDRFTYGRLIRFVLPSITMMIFTSIYSVIDGLFVSNFVGKTSFTAVNLVMPLLISVGSLGFMIGTGGSAIVAKTLGEGDRARADKYFSMLLYALIIGGITLSVIGQIALEPVMRAMGAQGELLDECILYGRITLISIMAFMLQNAFQSFMVTAEKPQTGLAIIVSAGITNIVLDFLLIAVFRLGIAGAAIATAASEFLGGIVPFIYFAKKNSSLLRLKKTGIQGKILLRACTNGASELMTNISMSLVNMLYNIRLLSIIGEDGVAAYGVIMYVNFIFISIFLGYSIGSAPIVGFNYGAGNHSELKGIFKKSMVIISATAILLCVSAELLSSPLSLLFVGYDNELYLITLNGFRLFSLSFIFCGFNIYGSAFFTALGNGFVSAAISFLRTFFFQIAALYLLPLILGLNGIWLSLAAAELLSLTVTVYFYISKRKKYRYL